MNILLSCWKVQLFQPARIEPAHEFDNRSIANYTFYSGHAKGIRDK